MSMVLTWLRLLDLLRSVTVSTGPFSMAAFTWCSLAFSSGGGTCRCFSSHLSFFSSCSLWRLPTYYIYIYISLYIYPYILGLHNLLIMTFYIALFLSTVSIKRYHVMGRDPSLFVCLLLTSFNNGKSKVFPNLFSLARTFSNKVFIFIFFLNGNATPLTWLMHRNSLSIN